MNQPIQQVQPIVEQEQPVDLARYLGFVSANRWFIAGIATLVVLAGTVYAFFSDPVYEANMLVQVEDADHSASRDIPGELANFFNLKAAAASEMEVLRSRLVLSTAVDNTHLYIEARPKYLPLLGSWMVQHEVRPPLAQVFERFGYVLDREIARVPVFDVPASLEDDTEFTLVALGNGRFRLLQEDEGIDASGVVGQPLRIATPKGPIELRVDELAARNGAQFLLTRKNRTETIDKLQDVLKIVEKGKQSDVVAVSLEGKSPKQTSAVLGEIASQYMRQNEDRKSEAAEKALAFLSKQLPELKQDLERAEAKYNDMRNSRGTVNLDEEGRNVLQQSVQAQTRLLELKQKKQELQARFADEHPAIRAVDAEMNTLEHEIAGLSRKIRKLPAIEQDVTRLTRDVKVNQEIYSALMSTVLQLRLVAASKVGSVRVLDMPVVPVKPVRPKRLLVIFLSGVAGLILGGMAAFARKNISRRIDDPDEIEESLGMRVSATIPYGGKREDAPRRAEGRSLALEYDRDDAEAGGIVESLRRLRSSMQFSMADAKNNIVVITGPTAGVGKSFVAANFAVVLAAIGKRVLLVDADLRTGHLHEYFGIERGTGLSDVIEGRALADRAVRKNVVQDVDFVSTGGLPSRPAELLASANFARLLQLFAGRYDFVLVDTPPVLAVSDAQIVVPHAGAVFNVVRGRISTLGEIEEAVKRLNETGMQVTGTIFNDWNPRLTRYRYGSRRYGKYVAAEAQ